MKHKGSYLVDTLDGSIVFLKLESIMGSVCHS